MDFKTALYLFFAVYVFSEYTRNIRFLELNSFFQQFFEYLHGYSVDLYDDSDDDDSDDDEDEDDDTPSAEAQSPPKYEDKYLADIRKLSKEWDFTADEMIAEENAFHEFFDGSIDTIKMQIENNEKDIRVLEKEMAEDTDIINCSESQDEEGDDVIHETTLEERNEYRNSRIAELQEECSKLRLDMEEGGEGIENLRLNARNQARDFIVNARLDKLKNNYVMEKTPLGNVLMIYDKVRGSFKYYADSTIPYRYLEPVGRKYVKLFNCRPLFVDMEEELKLVEEKWTKEYELKKAKEAEEKKRAESQKPVEQKKNVFAKFKSYNKDAGGKISMAAPPKNSIPSKVVPDTKENEKVLLKERANRYTYEGKFANFNFLQKIERKVFNKRLALSFNEFKKLQNK